MPTNYAILTLLLLGVAACTGEATKNPKALSSGEMTVVDTAEYQPLYVHPVLVEQELNSQYTSQGAYGQIMAPPMERLEAQILTRTYWVFEFYHDPNGSIAQRKVGQGLWYRFQPDGSFIGGHWDRQTHSGLWYLTYDGDKVFITIDSNVDRHDGKWDIQAIGREQDTMAWVRTYDFGTRTRSPIQGKLIELFNVPTKEQFGVQ